MLLRTQILLVFLSILTVSVGAASIFYYYSVRQTQLQEIYNNLESNSEAKKLRMKGIIAKRQEQIVMLQLKEQLREQFSNYKRTGNQKDFKALTASLTISRDKIPSFKQLHLVSMQGKVEVSSSSAFIGADFSGRESFHHALEGELCVHEFFYDAGNSLLINLSGLLELNKERLGVIMVEVESKDILSIIHDYTGLGETGETTLARRMGNKVLYLTPTRFYPRPGDSLLLPFESRRAMSHALAGEEKLIHDVLDYRGEEVVASLRYLPEVGWGLTTKMDKKEIMAPITASMQRTFLLTLFLIAAVAFAAHFFARHLVRPIVSLGEASKEISNGNLEKRIAYSSKNEVGQLAASFNLMADKLVETNRALERKVKELDQNNESLNRFAYVVSHDLKSPLLSIKGLVENLQESLITCEEPDVQKMLGMVENRASHMQNLISGILKYSMSVNTKAGQEQVNLQELTREVINHLQVPAHIEVTVEPLPTILMERVLIVQVFQNLIGNSIKYMDKPLGWVKVGCEKEGDFLRFFVADNGRGIQPWNLEKVFDIFNKVHDLPNIDSSGLGLSIVKKIVENKGGKIWVTSEEGVGSTFFFTLPAETAL